MSDGDENSTNPQRSEDDMNHSESEASNNNSSDGVYSAFVKKFNIIINKVSFYSQVKSPPGKRSEKRSIAGMSERESS
jgi:hypothetical protein